MLCSLWDSLSLNVDDLHADPGGHSLSVKCIASGRLVDPALACSLGDGKERMLLVGSVGGGAGTRRDFFLSLVLTSWLPLLLAGSPIGGSLLIFLYMRSLPCGGGRLRFLVLSL